MYVAVKKIIDRFLAFIGLIVLSPLFLILIIAIKFTGTHLFSTEESGDS